MRYHKKEKFVPGTSSCGESLRICMEGGTFRYKILDQVTLDPVNPGVRHIPGYVRFRRMYSLVSRYRVPRYPVPGKRYLVAEENIFQFLFMHHHMHNIIHMCT